MYDLKFNELIKELNLKQEQFDNSDYDYIDIAIKELDAIKQRIDKYIKLKNKGSDKVVNRKIKIYRNYNLCSDS
jgi:hypothetical protein